MRRTYVFDSQNFMWNTQNIIEQVTSLIEPLSFKPPLDCLKLNTPPPDPGLNRAFTVHLEEASFGIP